MILSAFAEFEREIIRERTINSLQRKKAEGYIFRGRPKGAKDLKKLKTTGYFERDLIECLVYLVLFLIKFDISPPFPLIKNYC